MDASPRSSSSADRKRRGRPPKRQKDTFSETSIEEPLAAENEYAVSEIPPGPPEPNTKPGTGSFDIQLPPKWLFKQFNQTAVTQQDTSIRGV